MNNKPQTVQRRSVAFPTKQLEQLEKLAAKQNTTTSELIRKFIDKGLAVESYQDNIDFISKIVRQEVKAEISLQVERFVKIMMKVGYLTSGSYFLLARVFADFISPSMQQSYKDVEYKTRRMGIEYMKKKDFDAVAFLEDDAGVWKEADKLNAEV